MEFMEVNWQKKRSEIEEARDELLFEGEMTRRVHRYRR